jgi:hypothetical protein
MGVRPKLYQLIGIDVGSVKGGQKWVDEFLKKYDDEEFISYTRDIFGKVVEDKEFLEEYIVDEIEDKETYEIIHYFHENEQNIFGMYPIFDVSKSSIYAHELLYAMVEGQMIPDKAKALKIPYEDFSHLIGAPKEKIKKETGYLPLVRTIENYKGVWGRDYPNHPMEWFDDDLEFSYLFFQSLGLFVSRNDIQRFIVFDWC